MSDLSAKIEAFWEDCTNTLSINSSNSVSLIKNSIITTYEELKKKNFTQEKISQYAKKRSLELTDQSIERIDDYILNFTLLKFILSEKITRRDFFFDDIVFAFNFWFLNDNKPKDSKVWLDLWLSDHPCRFIYSPETKETQYTIPHTFFPLINTKDTDQRIFIACEIIKTFDEIEKTIPRMNTLQVAQKLSKKIYFSQVTFDFLSLKIILQLIENPMISPEDLAKNVNLHINSIRLRIKKLIDNRLLHRRYRLNLRSIGLGTALVIVESNGDPLPDPKELPGVGTSNPWFFRLYFAESGYIISFVVPNTNNEGKRAIDLWRRKINTDYDLEPEWYFSDLKRLIRNYNFTSYSLLNKEWLVTPEVDHINLNYQQFDINYPPIWDLILQKETQWCPPQLEFLDELKWRIIDYFCRQTYKKDISSRVIRNFIQRGSNTVLKNVLEIQKRKIVVPYTEIIPRSFTNVMISIWNHNQELNHQELVNTLNQFPISWSNPYYKQDKNYTITLSTIVDPKVALLKAKGNKLLHKAFVFLPNQRIGNNWKPPMNRWSFAKNLWQIQKGDFFHLD